MSQSPRPAEGASVADNPELLERLVSEREQALRARDAARRELRRVKESLPYKTAEVILWAPHQLSQISRHARSRLRVARSKRTAAMSDRDDVSAPASKTPRSFARDASRVASGRVSSPDVSVVIPVYNSERWLDDCLTSVLAQTGATLEVICVDDGSTDGSASILHRYASEDARVRIIGQVNSGQSVARNQGLDAAVGRYVVYLDSDDFWSSDSLGQLVNLADENKLDVLLFDSSAFLEGTVPEDTWKRYETYYQRAREYPAVREGAQMIADMRKNRDYRPHVGMYLARTDHVRTAGVRFIPGIVHQDNPYSFGLLLAAHRVAHTGLDFYARRVRPGSTITSLSAERSVRGYFLSYVAMAREITGRTFDPEVSALLCDVVYGAFDGARKRIAELSPDSVHKLSELDKRTDAQLVLRALTR